MKRHALVVAVVSAMVAALAVAASSSPRPIVGPTRVQGESKAGPLFSIVQSDLSGDGPSYLTQVDRRTLRAVKRPRVVLGAVGSWSFSPDRRGFVGGRTQNEGSDDNGVDRYSSSLRFVDLSTMRATGDVALGSGYVGGVSWIAPSRVLVLLHHCCPTDSELVVVDASRHVVLSRQPFPYDVVQSAQTARALVLLVAPPETIGPARLAVVGSEGTVRIVSLDGISAGRQSPQAESSTAITTVRVPALAVDPNGTHAYVVGPDAAAVDVELQTLQATAHTLATPVSLLSRLRDWAEPRAEAKGIVGPSRDARWLGDGVLAVAGTDNSTYTDSAGKFQLVSRPSGLELVDTRTWAVRMVDRRAGAFAIVGNGLLASAASWDSGTGVQTGIGLTYYGLDGSPRFHLLGRHAAWVDPGQVVGDAAFFSIGDTRTGIVDVRRGRLLAWRASYPPWLLVGASSPFYG